MADSCRVLISLSVYETPRLALRLLDNLLSVVATDTRIVVHVGNLSWTKEHMRMLAAPAARRVGSRPRRCRRTLEPPSVLHEFQRSERRGRMDFRERCDARHSKLSTMLGGPFDTMAHREHPKV